MFDMLNRQEQEADENEYDKAMAASFIDVSSFFHQEENRAGINNVAGTTIWTGTNANGGATGPDHAPSTTATLRAGGNSETARLNATTFIDMPQQRYEIVKLTEDVMESGIDAKEWQQECRRVDRQL